MELDEFISESLRQIAKGVTDANALMAGGVASPSLKSASGQQLDIVSNGQNNIVKVSFDVAVTEASSAAGGAKISVVGIGMGGEAANQASIASRISFHLPLLLVSNPIPDGND